MTKSQTIGVRQHLRRLGRYLIELSAKPPHRDRTIVDPAGACDAEAAECLAASDLPELIALARKESWRRAQRARHIRADLIGEPAWDILLDIFANRAAGQRVSFTSICLATRVSAAAAVRWISVLESEGLLFRRRDPADRCCVWLDLTDLGMERMCAHFREVRS